jgi:hypothetical protein
MNGIPWERDSCSRSLADGRQVSSWTLPGRLQSQRWEGIPRPRRTRSARARVFCHTFRFTQKTRGGGVGKSSSRTICTRLCTPCARPIVPGIRVPARDLLIRPRELSRRDRIHSRDIEACPSLRPLCGRIPPRILHRNLPWIIGRTQRGATGRGRWDRGEWAMMVRPLLDRSLRVCPAAPASSCKGGSAQASRLWTGRACQVKRRHRDRLRRPESQFWRGNMSGQ